MKKCFEKIDLVLASQSPRRKQLLSDAGLKFRISVFPVDEKPLDSGSPIDTAIYLSELKAKAFPREKMKQNTLLLTADTVVSIDQHLLGKPKDKQDAIQILNQLSGRSHNVITAFTLSSKSKMKSFHAVTKVFFRKLSREEIVEYIQEYKPYDKAGAYGIQEWIGKIGIQKIEGSYSNVMGLPIHQVYQEICTFEM
jgi:septum formation protein